MIRRYSVYVATGLICLNASIVHADAAQDLMNALGLTSVSSTDTSVPIDLSSASVGVSLIGTSTASTTTPDPEAEKAKQIRALRDLVKTLTARLKALIASKKAAVASLSDTTEICSIKRELRRGMRGDDVKALQKFLVSESELETQLVSGSFGATTEEAVQQWQMHNGIVSYGSPGTTGYGYVGKSTLALIQQSCTKSAKGTYIDPALRKNSNMLATTTQPQSVRLALSIDGSAFKRGMKIPVRVTIQDPIPYLGADIEFMQTNSKGGINTFGSQIYLPVGFTGQVTHYIHSSHMEIQEQDKSFGTSEIPLSAIVEARFRDPNGKGVAGEDITRTFGMSDPVRIFISEDAVLGRLVYTVNGVDGAKSGDIKSDFAKFFSATTTSRATSIEYCDLLSEVVTKGAMISCKWNDEELSDIVKTKKKTIPAGPTGRTSGIYSMFMSGAISETQFSVSRQDALASCGRTHTDNPTTSITCVWENEIIYDKGGLDDPPPDKYIEPGAAPVTI